MTEETNIKEPSTKEKFNSYAKEMPIIAKWVRYLELRNVSEHTLRSYQNSLVLFFEYFTIETIENIDALTPEDYDDFLEYLRYEKKLEPSSINTHLRNLKACVNWLHDKKYITSDTINGTKSLKECERMRVIITDEEFEKMVEVSQGIQEKVMLYILRYAMLRRAEMCNLKISDFQENKKLLVNGKGKRQRKIELNSLTIRLLNEYLATRNDDDPALFVSQRGKHEITPEAIRQRVMRIAEDAGIDEERRKDIGPHSFRRTGITAYLNSGVDSMVVQRMAGHKSPSTTNHYVQNCDSAMEKAVNSTHVVGD